MEECDSEARDEGLCSLLVAGGVGFLEQAQQAKSDQGGIDLDLHGIFATSEECLDLEVLLDPLEEQFDLPTLLVEFSDLSGGTSMVVGHQMKRRFTQSGYDDLAQVGIVEPIGSAASRLLVTDPQGPIGQDIFSDHRPFLQIAAADVALQARHEERTGRNYLLPPVVVGVALIKDVGGARLQRHDPTAADIADFRRGYGKVNGMDCARIIKDMQLQAAATSVCFSPGEAAIFERDRGCVEKANESLCFLS